MWVRSGSPATSLSPSVVRTHSVPLPRGLKGISRHPLLRVDVLLRTQALGATWSLSHVHTGGEEATGTDGNTCKNGWMQVGGYRDLMLCCVLEVPNGLKIIGEIQVRAAAFPLGGEETLAPILYRSSLEHRFQPSGDLSA
jgi:hypothetical protein